MAPRHAAAVLVSAAVLCLSVSTPAGAQTGSITASAHARARPGSIAVVRPRPLTGVHACSAPTVNEGVAWRTVYRSRGMDEDEAKGVLAELHDSLISVARDRPDDVELQYLLAVVAGSRAEVEGGRTRVRMASEMHRRIQNVLALDPDHPGAYHLLGRLHAAVLRMDGFTRFVATRLMGGGELGDASWEDARLLLEMAVAGAPCVPDHHYELARLYAEQGDVRRAVDRLHDLLTLIRPDGPFGDVYRKGRILLDRLEGRP
jgi:hypothetical protein